MSKMMTRFNNVFSSCNYVFKDGRIAVFTNGVFYTDDAEQIAELKAEIVRRSPYISGGEEVTEESLDPLYSLKQKFFAEFKEQEEAKRQAALNPNNDMGGNDGVNDKTFGAMSSQETMVAIAAEAPRDLRPTEQADIVEIDKPAPKMPAGAPILNVGKGTK